MTNVMNRSEEVRIWSVKLIIFVIMSVIYYALIDDYQLFVILISFVVLFVPDIFTQFTKVYKYLSAGAALTIIVLGIMHTPEWFYYLPLLHFLLIPLLKSYLTFSLVIYLLQPDYLLIVIGILSILIIYLLSKIDELEHENNQIRDKLTTDNLKLVEQRNALSKNVEREVELASLAERNRIARDMHDAVGHSLSSSLLLIESLQYINDIDKIHPALTRVQYRLKTGMDDIRESIHTLYSTSFDLERRLETMLGEMVGYETKLYYTISSQLKYDLKLDLLSVAKESLTNIRKHSKADKVGIYVIENKTAITLKITDNGTVDDKSSYGMGQHSMKETAQKYNGIFNAGMQSDGYMVYISIKKEGNLDEDTYSG